ncbi:hypothetical protein DSL72_007638 [Monilinia vaccinii-corymbosi]|uniref:Zn(2)-C6 fungal-type domain-containing protein n=1 Tax=Monilinia vaccinii-corymbosi TaxID=61207 RepID=A0A8A3PI76_9HELO|nr:hypothetical protein DSL72_007638 [Monilinia vaccinii-corymbosi]
MMPSGHHHPNHQAQDASDSKNPKHQMLAQNASPLDVLGTPGIDEFKFPCGFAENSVTQGDPNLDTASDSFKIAASIEHRNAHGSISGPAARHRSLSGGSEEVSPMSNRMRGLQGGDAAFGEDLGMNTGGPKEGSEEKRKDQDKQAPAWTELKTKAGKDRKRLPLACTECRRKKIRCSGESGGCKNCAKSRSMCNYKVSQKKAVPRTDYMAMVEKRLKRMEARIMNIVPKEEQNSTLPVVRANFRPPIPGTLPSQNSTGKKRPADEAFEPELNNWSRSARKDGSRNGNGNGNGNQGSRSNMLLAQEEEESKLLKEGAEKLPSLELQEHLAEVFFESVYGQTYHLLHKPSFMRKLKDKTLPPVLILAVCACAARFSEHVELDTEPAFLRGEEWASEAREIVLKRYDWPNLTILTCLLILAFHEFGTCQGGRSWSLAGQAIRMAQALQLHKDLDYDPEKRNPDDGGNFTKLSFIDREIRRRTMWACFLMDRFESSGTGRPTVIKEEDLEIQLPIKEHMFLFDIPGPTENLRGEIARPITPGGQIAKPTQNMGVAAYVIRSIAIYSHVITYFNQGGHEKDPHPMWHPESKYPFLVKQLEDFQKAMPDDMVYNIENLRAHKAEGLANQFIFLYVVIQQTTLSLNRFAVPLEPSGPLSKAPKEFVTKLGTKAIEAAEKIAQLIADGGSCSITAPFIGFCAFSASTILTLGAFSKNPKLEASSKKNLTITVTYLAKMKKYWGMFHWMSEKLKIQFRICADNAVAGSNGALNAVSLNYGDWFEQFPHGVSKSDYEDPATPIKKQKGDDAILEHKSSLVTVEKYVQGLPSPGQRSNPKPTKLKIKRTQSSSQHSQPSQPQQLGRVQQTMPNMQTSHLGMQLSTPSSSHQQISPQQAPQNSYSQSILSPTALCPPPPQFPTHRQLLMPSQQPHDVVSQQLDAQLAFNDYTGLDHSMNGNVLYGDGTGINWEDIGWMGNVFDGMGLQSELLWLPPFNTGPPDIGMGGGMNGDDAAFGGAAFERDFEMRIGEQRAVGMDTDTGGVNGHVGMGGHSGS